jgi:DNA-binding transcriptional regulator YhcF (GntR family)
MNMSTPDSALSGKMEELSQFLGRVPISDQIAEAIRSMIIAGQLSPGERIVESRVAKQLSVGQPTVREALVALEHQGLVVRKANQGCVVTKLTRGEISQMLRVRGELETLAVELAVEHASDAEIEELIGFARALKVAARKRNIPAFFQTDFWEQLPAAGDFAGDGPAAGVPVHSQRPQSPHRHGSIWRSAHRNGGSHPQARQGHRLPGAVAEVPDVHGPAP